MEVRSMTKRVLAIVSPDAPERSLLDALADMRIEYDLLENPQEALNMPPEDRLALDLAILILEYPSMRGPELAWRLRRRCPRLPILMLAEDLGTWEESDIRDLGVNVIVAGLQDHESFKNHLTLLFEEHVGGVASPSHIAEYERIVNDVVGDPSVPARIVDSRRIILYENRPLFDLVGSNVGRSCFEFWDAAEACSDCLGFLALDTGRKSSRVLKTADGGKLRLEAIPVSLDDESQAVVEAFYFLDRS